MFKGMIQQGVEAEITFQADASNSGSTSVLLGTVPKPGGANATNVAFDMVAPGGGVTKTLTVPHTDEAFAIRIDVDVPDGTGRGTLIVKTDGTTKDESDISADVQWTYAIAAPSEDDTAPDDSGSTEG